MNVNRCMLLLQDRLPVALTMGVWVLLVFSGCQKPASKEAIGPVFYPEPPDKPRLQFLKSFSGPKDVGVKGPSGFQKFIIGEPEVEEKIGKPYGIAMFEDKLYVCDVGRRLVEVLDLGNNTFGYLTKDRRLVNPMSMYIDNGTKYVTDSGAGAVFVFDRNDTLTAILGKELDIKPLDVVVREELCYITDTNKNQVVVINKRTGQEITRIGQEGDNEGQFKLISDLALDKQGNIYVTDRVKGQIVKFDKSGVFQRTFGQLGDNIDEFVRPKGIAVDMEGRIWVADAATEIVKILDPEGRLLLFFGLPGNKPGMVNLPAGVKIDYDNVGMFQQYAVPGATLEFLVFVANQYGANKINVYGFGNFPETNLPLVAEPAQR